MSELLQDLLAALLTRTSLVRLVVFASLTGSAYLTMRIHAVYQWEQHVASEVKELGGNVVFEYTGPKALPQSAQDRLPYLRRIQSMTLIGQDVPEDRFAKLEALTILEDLWLDHAQFGDLSLAHLKGKASLRRIALRHTSVGEGIEHLHGLSGLEELDLNYTQVTDAGLVQIGKLSNLKRLNLYDTRITDAGLESLSQLPKLTHLQIGRTQITDAGLQSLKRLKTLELLDLTDSPVTDDGIVQLKELYRLESLILSGTAVSDAGLEYLKKLPRLTTVRLSYTRVTRAGRSALRAALPLCRVIR